VSCDSGKLIGHVGHPGAYSRPILAQELTEEMGCKDEQWARLDQMVSRGRLL